MPVWTNMMAAHIVPERYPLINIANSINPAFNIQEGLIMPSIEMAPVCHEMMDINAHKIKIAKLPQITRSLVFLKSIIPAAMSAAVKTEAYNKRLSPVDILKKSPARGAMIINTA
jgi:hypothetical protein